jgi:hypothetical protein
VKAVTLLERCPLRLGDAIPPSHVHQRLNDGDLDEQNDDYD